VRSEPPKPSAWAVDTSWLFGFLDQKDLHHQKARREAEERGLLLLNPITLVETLELVQWRAGREGSIAALRAILMIPQLRLMEAPKAAAMARWVERHGRLSWADASVLCTAQSEGAGLRTFDANQRKAFAALA
jgi:predicted nucleic acid-binding protein